MIEPDLFCEGNSGCDLIEEHEYQYCFECYRYETCKAWWKKNTQNGCICDLMDGRTYFHRYDKSEASTSEGEDKT